MKWPDFFKELQRRNVYRVAVAYAVVAWLLIQVATQVFPFLQIPDWCIRLVIIICALGFPIALVLAWIFELTPEGVQRSEEVAPEDSKPQKFGRKLDFIIIGVFALIIALLVFDRLRGGSDRAATARGKSIAVLPFENFSDKKEDLFFADGIQDDILTNLARISDLKVISRTSVMGYRGGGRNLREIARALDVANILEGSVRREKDRVLVNVQLIDAQHDRHIWADRYDRTLTDAISLQGELAMEIASALRTTLSPEEKARVETAPTQNPEAYTWYLKGREAEAHPDISLTYLRQAEEYYGRAVALDPQFVLARARLAHMIAQIYHEFEPTPARAQRARAEAEEALRADPNLGEAHLALGDWFYWIAFDYDAALRELDAAEKLLPNNSDVPVGRAAIYRRQGKWRQSAEQFERAMQLDPRNAGIVQEFIYSKFLLRDWEGATALAQRALTIDPTAPVCIFFRAFAEYWRTGDAARAEALFDQLRTGEDVDGTFLMTKFEFAMLQRDFTRAEQLLVSSPRESILLPSSAPLPKNFLRASVALARGDQATAGPLLQSAAADYEKMVAKNPDDPARHAYLGLTYAWLGRKEDALHEADRAVALRPESKDAVIGPQMSAIRTVVLAWAGETERALSELERLITLPGPMDLWSPSVTQVDLKNRWIWDPLRNEPRFQKLLGSPERKTIYH